jgi:hypothetical protein
MNESGSFFEKKNQKNFCPFSIQGRENTPFKSFKRFCGSGLASPFFAKQLPR